MFSGSAFQPHLSALRPTLGLTFSDMKVTWDQYAPQVRTDVKQVRDEIMPATTAPSNSTGPATNAAALLAPPAGAPVTSPTNLTTPPAYQQQTPSSPMTPILLVVGALALAGTGAWYFFFRKK